MNGEICPACGFSAPISDGATHAYMSPSAGCWAFYGEILAREYSDLAYWDSHRLLTDAYCAHHSIADERRARQSLNIHLAALMLHFEDGAGPAEIIAFLKATAGSRDFAYLARPDGKDITLAAIHGAQNAAEHASAVDTYAQAVFDFWSPHHPTIRTLIERANL